MSELDQAVERLRRHLNLDQRRGILGDNSGVVRDTTNGGYYVRIEKSPGNYYPPVSIPLSNTATVTPKANIPVYVGYDPIGKRDVIVGMVPTGLEQIGISPFVTNPADPAAADLIPQERLSPLYSRPHTDTATKPYYAIVYPAKLIRQDGILVSWSGGEINLASYLPAAGLHRYVAVFLKEDFATLEAAGSVAQATSSALGDSDLNEALTGGSPGSIPIRAYKMASTDLSLSAAFADSPFLRQFITTRTHYPGATYFDASQITYSPPAPTYWDYGVDPGQSSDALNQLVRRVQALEDYRAPLGSIYGNDIAWVQVSAAQNTWYEIADSDMTDGQLNQVTHDGNGKLTVSKAGKYHISYDLVALCSTAGKELQSGISISGTENDAGLDHEIATNANAKEKLSSHAILDLAANATIEIAIRTTDAGTPNITVEHLNVTLFRINMN